MAGQGEFGAVGEQPKSPVFEEGSVFCPDSPDRLVGVTMSMGQKGADNIGDIQSETGLNGLNEKVKKKIIRHALPNITRTARTSKRKNGMAMD